MEILNGRGSEIRTNLKAEPGRELQVHGSLNLIQTLIEAGLVDEFRLVIALSCSCTGKRLFDDIVSTGLKLIDSKPTSTGAMLQTDQTAGRPAYGTFPPGE